MASDSSGHAVKFPFPCGFCGKRFKSHAFLAEHKMRYRNSHFYCRRCRLDFPSAPELYQHLDTPFETVAFEPGSGGVRCLRCNVKHESMSEFDSHFSERHPNGCKHCHLDFHNIRALQKHLEAEHPNLSSVPEHNALMGEPNIDQNPAAGSTDVQEEAAGPVIEAHQEDDVSATVDGGISPTAEPSGDHGAPSLPARPIENDFGTRGPFPRRQAYYCDRCSYGFATLSELKQHLDHSTPVLERHSTPDGGVRCFACHTLFSSVDGFKQHLQTLDYYHRLRLSKWCIPCLLKFHTRSGLDKHKLSVHALPPLTTSTEELPSTPPPPQFTAPALDTAQDFGDQNTQDEASGPVVSAEVADAPRPIDLLFASILLSNQITRPEPPSAPETPEVVEALTPVQPSWDLPEDVQPTTAQDLSASIAPDLSASTPTPTTSSARARRPFRMPASRTKSLFCRSCQLTFSNHSEQREHVRKGMSAIISDENNEGRLVCAQCKESFDDIHPMKAHLPSHEATCLECLIYFHGPRWLQEHRESLHATDPVGSGGPASEPTQPQLNPIRHSPFEPRPGSPAPEPTQRPAPSAPREVRSVLRAPQPASRNHRTVRQISLQDFSDTDEDDPSDIDNSQLAGWQESGPQGQRRPDANAYSVRTGGNVSGRNSRPGGRRTAEEQRWWWEGQPPATSWDALASGRIPQGPHPIELATSSKSATINPKAPRISSVAVPCCVCLEEAAVDLTATPCGHAGCETCLRTAVKTKPECPICRKPTRPSDLRPLFL